MKMAEKKVLVRMLQRWNQAETALPRAAGTELAVWSRATVKHR